MYNQDSVADLPYFENFNKSRGTLSLSQYYNLADEEKYLFDNRLKVISEITCKDPFQLYLYYLALVIMTSNIVAPRSQTHSRYTALLDMGYVPVVMVPIVTGPYTYVCRAILKLYPKKMRDLGIPYIIEYTRSPDGKSVSSDLQDVWVSRLDIAKFMNCDPMQIHIGDFLRRIADAGN